MAITFPDIFPESESWGLESNTGLLESELDKSVQTNTLSGGRWVASQTFVNVPKAKAFQLKAFLASLRGRSGQALLVPYEARSPMGTVSGTPLVAGASQTGTSLDTDGWSASQTVLRTGDYFEVNGELKMATADVTSDGSGAATINFEPELRDPPANNAAITVNNPTCVMRLDSDDSEWQSSVKGKYYGFSMRWVEAY